MSFTGDLMRGKTCKLLIYWLKGCYKALFIKTWLFIEAK